MGLFDGHLWSGFGWLTEIDKTMKYELEISTGPLLAELTFFFFFGYKYILLLNLTLQKV